jgi:hypothetical protein
MMTYTGKHSSSAISKRIWQWVADQLSDIQTTEYTIAPVYHNKHCLSFVWAVSTSNSKLHWRHLSIDKVLLPYGIYVVMTWVLQKPSLLPMQEIVCKFTLLRCHKTLLPLNQHLRSEVPTGCARSRFALVSHCVSIHDPLDGEVEGWR